MMNNGPSCHYIWSVRIRTIRKTYKQGYERVEFENEFRNNLIQSPLRAKAHQLHVISFLLLVAYLT